MTKKAEEELRYLVRNKKDITDYEQLANEVCQKATRTGLFIPNWSYHVLRNRNGDKRICLLDVYPQCGGSIPDLEYKNFEQKKDFINNIIDHCNFFCDR